MLLRGFDGGVISDGQENVHTGRSILYVVFWLGGLVFLRIVPVFRLAGSLLSG